MEKKCNRHSMSIDYANNTSLALNRCCALQANVISFEEFYNSSFEDICKKAINYKKLPGREDSCSKDIVCDFSYVDDIVLCIMDVCNFKCYHCCSGHPKKTLDAIEKKNHLFNVLNYLSKNVPKNTLNYLGLDGTGEIFIYYNELIEFLSTIDNSFTKNMRFLTNGSLLDEDRIKQLKEISNKTGVNYTFIISIDGISKETFEAVRVGGNFEKTMEVLKLLNTYFKPENITIHFTIKKPNVKEVPYVINFFNQNYVSFLYDCFDPSLSALIPDERKWR